MIKNPAYLEYYPPCSERKGVLLHHIIYINSVMFQIMRIYKPFSFSAAILFALTISATNYYASPSGTGTGASSSSPCSLSTALGKIASGDSLFLFGGQYNLSSSLTISKSGSSSKRTFVGAFPGEKPILDFRKQSHGKNGVALGGQYIHLKGLIVRYAGYKGLLNSGSYNVMELLDVYGNCDSGIQQKGGNNNLILNCDSHDNFDFLTMSDTYCDYGGNADGFADKQYTNSPGNTYIGCRSWNNSDDGWDCFQRVGGTTIIKNCVCYHNGPLYYDMSNYARLAIDKDWFNKFQKDTVVVNKNGVKYTCSIKHYYNNGNGNGFKLGGGSTKHDVTLYNCLAVGNRVKGFDQNSDAGAIQIYNGTSYLNGSNYGFYNNNGYSLVIKNCVSLDGLGGNSFTGSYITQSNNTWNAGFSCTDADFISLDTTMVTRERDAEGNLKMTDFLRVKKGSSLIDKGQFIDGVEYKGAAPDLGCFETDYLSAGIAQVVNSNRKTTDGVSVYNSVGMLVFTSTYEEFLASNLPHGMYILRTPADHLFVAKVTK